MQFPCDNVQPSLLFKENLKKHKALRMEDFLGAAISQAGIVPWHHYMFQVDISRKNDNQIKQITCTRNNQSQLINFEKAPEQPEYWHAPQFSNSFLFAAYTAFCEHCPFLFHPDQIWALFLQGLSIHIHQNSPELKKYFSTTEGKIDLLVRRDDFLLSGENPWEEVVQEWNQQLSEHVGELYAVLRPQFSTSTQKYQILHNCCILNAMSDYFSYTLETRCQLPHASRRRLAGQPVS